MLNYKRKELSKIRITTQYFLIHQVNNFLYITNLSIDITLKYKFSICINFSKFLIIQLIIIRDHKFSYVLFFLALLMPYTRLLTQQQYHTEKCFLSLLQKHLINDNFKQHIIVELIRYFKVEFWKIRARLIYFFSKSFKNK